MIVSNQQYFAQTDIHSPRLFHHRKIIVTDPGYADMKNIIIENMVTVDRSDVCAGFVFLSEDVSSKLHSH